MHAFLKPEKLLAALQLGMGVTLTLEDPISSQPITIAYENLHKLLVIDVENLLLEGQVISNLYAEMARFQRAAEWEADRAEIRYVNWKAGKAAEHRESVRSKADQVSEPPVDPPEDGKKPRKTAKSASPAKATVGEVEEAYRTHADYEAMALPPKRWKAIAGIFEDLKWAFKEKAAQMRDASRTFAGYANTDRNGDAAAGLDTESAEDRLSSYTQYAQQAAQQAAEFARQSGSSEAMQQLLASVPATSNPPPPGRRAAPLE